MENINLPKRKCCHQPLVLSLMYLSFQFLLGQSPFLWTGQKISCTHHKGIWKKSAKLLILLAYEVHKSIQIVCREHWCFVHYLLSFRKRMDFKPLLYLFCADKCNVEFNSILFTLCTTMLIGRTETIISLSYMFQIILKQNKIRSTCS